MRVGIAQHGLVPGKSAVNGIPHILKDFSILPYRKHTEEQSNISKTNKQKIACITSSSPPLLPLSPPLSSSSSSFSPLPQRLGSSQNRVERFQVAEQWVLKANWCFPDTTRQVGIYSGCGYCMHKSDTAPAWRGRGGHSALL